MNPSDVGFSDRLVVQEVIKEIAQTHTLDPTKQKNFKGNQSMMREKAVNGHSFSFGLSSCRT